jgi:hypothetical protein
MSIEGLPNDPAGPGDNALVDVMANQLQARAIPPGIEPKS